VKLYGSSISCPICKHPTITPEDQEYIRCISCGAIRTKYHYDSTIYREDYAETYLRYATNPQVNTPLNLSRLGVVSRWLRPGQTLLDIGCCIGEFLRFAEQHYNCVGFEPNQIAAGLARQRIQSKVIEMLDSDVKAHIITMFDVLEHLEDPLESLKSSLRACLTGGGVLILVTPNVSVVPLWEDAQLRAWKHWKAKEHLWLWTEPSLGILAEKLGLRVLYRGREESDIRPGNERGDIITFAMGKGESR
jgi:2-polyprenyl-3-methyl-5-hydroxy-6-metoxy-1,4-benzoquinol methylase